MARSRQGSEESTEHLCFGLIGGSILLQVFDARDGEFALPGQLDASGAETLRNVPQRQASPGRYLLVHEPPCTFPIQTH